VSRSQFHLVFSIICDSADVSQARTTRSDRAHVTWACLQLPIDFTWRCI